MGDWARRRSSQGYGRSIVYCLCHDLMKQFTHNTLSLSSTPLSSYSSASSSSSTSTVNSSSTLTIFSALTRKAGLLRYLLLKLFMKTE